MEIEQNKIIESHWKKRKRNKFIKSKFDVLILASIIEKEGKKSEELKNISSVFLNRLNKNMKLQSDVTVAYALNKKGNNLNKLDLKSKNYFNTYRYRGLPPTPICYPGEKAILAVLYPNDTDYLYFVSNGKGGHRFSKNFSEHKKNIKLWIKDLKTMAKIKKEGVLLVISSPSGTGKTTICKKLLEYDKNIHLSVSVTTRKKRKNEVEGIDYYFRSKKDFLNLKSQNSFIENALCF